MAGNKQDQVPEERQFGRFKIASPDVRKSQAMLYKRIHEKTLTISVLEQYRSILDEDISIVCCCNCYSKVKLEPLMPQEWMETDKGFIKTDLEDVCNMIQSGRCDCGGTLDEELHSLVSCRLAHLASMMREYLPVLMFLNKEGCDLNTVTNNTQSTPLLVAIGFYEPEIVRYLLSVGVQVNIKPDSDQTHPLTLAIHYEREDIVAMLLKTKQIDVNTCVDNYSQPLLISCVRLHPEFVEVLLEAGADPNLPNPSGVTALMYAVSSRDIESVKLLIRYGADVNTKNRRGEMALTIVVYREDVQMVQMLLDAGADPNYCTHDGHDNSLLLLASYDGCFEIMKALIKHGSFVGQPNDIGYTPLHIAAWNGHLECVKLLLDSGAPHDERTKDGNTPLALAAHGNHLSVIEALLPLGCEVNNADKDQDTPLQYAAYNGMTRAVELLIEHGANPNMVNSVNATALWNAVYMKHKEVVKLLLIANVDMELESIGINQHSQTDQVVYIYDAARSPLWVAAEENSPDIALLLITAGYNIHREKWILNDQFPPNADNTRLNSFLLQYAHSPQRLVAICRNFFRHFFKLEVRNKVNSLNIPGTLKSYLNLADLKYTVEEKKESQ